MGPNKNGEGEKSAFGGSFNFVEVCEVMVGGVFGGGACVVCLCSIPCNTGVERMVVSGWCILGVNGSGCCGAAGLLPGEGQPV